MTDFSPQHSEEHVILVDSNDQPLSQMGKLIAHQQGLLHRAFSVMLYQRRENDLYCLLQQRALSKYHSAGLWTNTCCSHPHWGESTLEAAQRRLKEEMGIDQVELTWQGSFIYQAILENGLTEHELDHVYTAEVKSDIQIKPETSEVMAYRWMNIKELRADLSRYPGQYTVWLASVLNYCDFSVG